MVSARAGRRIPPEKLPGYDLVDLSSATPIVLRGTPRHLVGRIPLQNRGEDVAVLRVATVRDPEGRLGPQGEVSHRMATKVLRPNQTDAVRLRLRLDPTTPPGEYRTEVEVGGGVRPLVLQIAEVIDLDLSPSLLVVENRQGKAVEKSVSVTNRGNVPLVIGDIGAVVLDDERFECRTLRRAAAKLGSYDGEVTVDSLVTEIARASREVLERSGALRVRNLTGTVTVAPGETVRIDLRIDVPSTLESHTRYVGTVPIYTEDLRFLVVPVRSPAEPSDAEPARAPARARKTASPARKSTGRSPTKKP